MGLILLVEQMNCQWEFYTISGSKIIAISQLAKSSESEIQQRIKRINTLSQQRDMYITQLREAEFPPTYFRYYMYICVSRDWKGIP